MTDNCTRKDEKIIVPQDLLGAAFRSSSGAIVANHEHRLLSAR